MFNVKNIDLYMRDASDMHSNSGANSLQIGEDNVDYTRLNSWGKQEKTCMFELLDDFRTNFRGV